MKSTNWLRYFASALAALSFISCDSGSYTSPSVGGSSSSVLTMDAECSFSVYTEGTDLLIYRRYKKGRMRISQAHDSLIACAAISRRSRYMASGDSKGIVKIWDMSRSGGIIARKPRLIDSLAGYVSSVQAMAFSPDEKHLVVLGDDGTQADVWSIEKKQLAGDWDGSRRSSKAFVLETYFPGQGEPPEFEYSRARLEYAPDEMSLAMDSANPNMTLQDRISGKSVDGERASAVSYAWRDSGRYKSYGQDRSVFIWKLCPSRECRFTVSQSP